VTDIILFAHPTFGVLGILSALWVFVEALNASDSNRTRIRRMALLVPLFMVLAWLLGGYWYVTHYGVDKAVILNGPWPFAHDVFMETKEHLFFVPAILALYLPIVAAANLAVNRGARTMVLVVAALIVVNGLVIEGAGAVINHGAKLALIQGRSK
jgi:hypothetical protein